MTDRSRTVQHPGGSYPYSVGTGLLSDFRALVDLDGPVAVVSDARSAELFLPKLEPVELAVVLPTGRNQKTLEAVQEVHRQMLDARLDRSATVVSLGDSIVSDVASFAAATYLRGVDVVHIPTELIAMIDTSIGGKVGLDVPHGRNLIGLFKQPKAVVADVTTLLHLTDLDFSAGMAEVVKHGLIEGGAMLDTLESTSWAAGRHRDEAALAALESLVADAAAVKIEVVEEDPHDEDRRQVLNLGHTFGYAFESATYGELSHGLAVGLGLVAAADLSLRLDLCPDSLPARVTDLVGRVGVNTMLPRAVDYRAIERALAQDKKRRGSDPRFVLLNDIGEPVVRTVRDHAVVSQVVTALQPQSV